MEVFMKSKVFTRAIVAGMLIFLALALVTCELENPGVKPSNVEYEYSDWEYVEMPDGTAQLTVYLDGTTPIPVKQQNRALNLGIAKRSHDFFEAVFVSGTTVARAAWEIGQPAGIRGVARGVQYEAISGSNKSIIFVGKKEGGSEGRATLLGVGYLSHVDGVLIPAAAPGTAGMILATTKNVTFTVSALTTEVGFVDFEADPLVLHDTFLTSTLPTATPAIPTAITSTQAAIAQFKGGSTFTIFGLPAYDEDAATDILVGAKYTFLGLSNTAMPTPPAGTPAQTLPSYAADLSVAIFHWDTNAVTPLSNFQILERVGIYMANGQTYDVPEALDTVTTVKLDTSYDDAAGKNFVPEIPLVFTITKGSGGVFAFTFQTPVYALTNDPSTNGGPEPGVWYIRPAYGQQQYLLDNGKNVGGAVLMGVGIGAMDWLDIFVDGFGFTNTPKTN